MITAPMASVDHSRLTPPPAAAAFWLAAVWAAVKLDLDRHHNGVPITVRSMLCSPEDGKQIHTSVHSEPVIRACSSCASSASRAGTRSLSESDVSSGARDLKGDG